MTLLLVFGVPPEPEPPGAGGLGGYYLGQTYLGGVPESQATVPLGTSGAVSTGTLGLTAPTLVPVAASDAASTSTAAVTAATQVPLSAADAVSAATLAISAPTGLPLGSSAAQATTALAVSAATEVPLNASDGVATTALAVSAQTEVALNASAATATPTLALSAPTVVPLAGSDAVSSATLAATAQTQVPLNASVAQSSATLSLGGAAVEAPGYVGLGGSYLGQVPLGGDYRSLAGAELELNPSAGQSTTSLQIGFVGRVEPDQATAQSSATLALTAPQTVPLAASSSTATGSLAVSAQTYLLLNPSVAFGIPQALGLNVPTQVPLATSSATAAGTITITLYTPLPLNPAVGVSNATLTVTEAPFRAPRSDRPTVQILEDRHTMLVLDG